MQYFTAEKPVVHEQVEDDLEDVDMADVDNDDISFAADVPAVNNHIRFEDDDVVENRKRYFNNFFYTFYNAINLQMMLIRLTRTLSSTMSRVCTVCTHLTSLRYLFNVIVSESESEHRKLVKLEVDMVYTPSPPHNENSPPPSPSWTNDVPMSSVAGPSGVNDPVPSWTNDEPLSPVAGPSGVVRFTRLPGSEDGMLYFSVFFFCIISYGRASHFSCNCRNAFTFV